MKRTCVPFNEELKKKMSLLCTMEYYSAVKKTKIKNFADVRMDVVVHFVYGCVFLPGHCSWNKYSETEIYFQIPRSYILSIIQLSHKLIISLFYCKFCHLTGYLVFSLLFVFFFLFCCFFLVTPSTFWANLLPVSIPSWLSLSLCYMFCLLMFCLISLDNHHFIDKWMYLQCTKNYFYISPVLA